MWHNGRLCDGLWGLGLAVVTAMVNSLGENDAGALVLDNALTYFYSEKYYILCGFFSCLSTFSRFQRDELSLELGN